MSSETEATLRSDRRRVLKGAAIAGLAAIVPQSLSALEQEPQLRLGPGLSILNVPENRQILARIEATKQLTPEQLLRIATVYRDNPSTAPIAYKLAATAMAMLSSSAAVNRAMASVGKTEIEWSWWSDAWKAVKDFFTGGTDQKDPAHCQYKCVGLLVVSALLEKCGDHDSWHVIGVCSGFRW